MGLYRLPGSLPIQRPYSEQMNSDEVYSVDQRGFDANGDGDFDDMGDIAPEDLVVSRGQYPEYGDHQVGIYTDSKITHNSGTSPTDSSIFFNSTIYVSVK